MRRMPAESIKIRSTTRLSGAVTACPDKDQEVVRWPSPMSRGRLFVTTIELHAGGSGFNSPFNRGSETATPQSGSPGRL